jgi:hypothetical protein
MIAFSYANVQSLPIFGYGAKTSSKSQKPATIFPLSKGIRTPFTSNDDEMIDQNYLKCLNSLEMALPVNLNPFLSFFKQLGVHVKTSLAKKASSNKQMKNTCNAVYVLYVLTSSLIDDIKTCL